MPGRASAPSVAFGLALCLSGCAGLTGGKEPVSVDEAPRSGLPGQGSFTVKKGRPGYVIGVPHGTTDTATDLMGLELARSTGFGAVIAVGFGKLDAHGRRYNVNRPTEGVAGEPPRSEAESEAARRVFDGYSRSVAEAAQGPLRVYVEIHGNGHQETTRRVEIATVGVSMEEAWRIKTLLELVRDAHLRRRSDAVKLEILVEPVDTLRYGASATKSIGALGRSERALHIELPKSARTTYRDVYAALLGDFLRQWADLQASTPSR